MTKFIAAWGPPMLGGAISIAAGTGALAAGLAAHWLLLPTFLAVAIVAAIASALDLDGGPSRRRDKVACSSCYCLGLTLAKVSADRDELREALAVLSLPEDRKP